MTAHSAALAGIVGLLRQARQRHRTNRFIAALVWAIAIAIAITAGLGALHRFAPATWVDWFGVGGDPVWLVAGMAMAGAALVLAVLLPVAIARTPALAAVARAADATFDLKERISTVLEVTRPERGGYADAVHDALTRDALEQQGSIDPRALAPHKLPKAAWSLPVLMLCAGLAWLLPSAPNDGSAALPATGESVAATSAPLTDAERTTLASAIERIAEAVEVEAVERDDQYMEAVANTLETLAAQIATNPTMDRGEVLAELDRLADYAGGATEEWGEAGAELTAMLESAGRMVDPAALPTDSTEGRSSDRANTPVTERQVPRGNSDSNVGDMREGAEEVGQQGYEAGQNETLVDKMQQFNMPNQGEDAGPSGEGTPTEAQSDFYSMVEREAQRQTRRADAIGNFQQGRSGDFTDPMANPWGGESTQQMGSDSAAANTSGLPDVEFDTDAELMLEASEADQGRSVLKDTPPITQFTEVEDRASPTGNAGWTPQPVAPVRRGHVGPDRRDTVGAYFMGMNAEVAQ